MDCKKKFLEHIKLNFDVYGIDIHGDNMEGQVYINEERGVDIDVNEKMGGSLAGLPYYDEHFSVDQFIALLASHGIPWPTCWVDEDLDVITHEFEPNWARLFWTKVVEPNLRMPGLRG